MPAIEAITPARIESRPSEIATLYRELLIGVTSFFRDREVFDALGDAGIVEDVDLAFVDGSRGDALGALRVVPEAVAAGNVATAASLHGQCLATVAAHANDDAIGEER